MTVPGEIVLEQASRSFRLPGERSRTLKELLVHRLGSGSSSVHALREVDLRIAPGEAVGIVGRNGAGKTSLLRVLTGIVPLDSGRIEVGGRVAALLELGAGFSDEFTGRENIELAGALHGFGREEIAARTDDIIDFSELGPFIDAPLRSYSSGMFLRLGFAIAAHLDADVLLVDEILAVGDEAFQRKCLRRIAERMAEGATLVIVSHDPATIERACRRVVVLEAGRVAYDGAVAEGIIHYHRMLDAGEAAESPSRTEGTGPLEVSSVRLLDAGGASRSVFRPGEPLSVSLSLRSRAPATRPGVAFEVRDQAGSICFRTDTTVEALGGQGAASGAELAYEIPALRLLGGDYDLAVSAYDQDDSTRPRSLDRVVRFSVAHAADGEGIADLRGRWLTATPTGEHPLASRSEPQ